MPFDNLLIDRDGSVAILTINRPKVNALNSVTMDELRRGILEAGHDKTIRAVVLTGAGDKAFVAGADIEEMARLTPEAAQKYALMGQHVFNLVEHLGKPVIAAINGSALGGGCELAMACTFRFASRSARLGQPEVKLGLIPGFAGTQRLPRLVGRAKALELLLTGESVDAEEARRLGLVDRVFEPEALMPAARAFAASLAEKAPLAVRHIMEAVTRGAEMGPSEGAAHEATLFGLTFSTEDMREGTQAFLQKRAPEFKGK